MGQNKCENMHKHCSSSGKFHNLSNRLDSLYLADSQIICLEFHLEQGDFLDYLSDFFITRSLYLRTTVKTLFTQLKHYMYLRSNVT